MRGIAHIESGMPAGGPQAFGYHCNAYKFKEAGEMDPITIMTCIALTVYDGDTVRCDGELLRPMGPGAPFVSGFDTPEIGFRADCEEEDRLGRLATTRMVELVKLPGLQIEDSGEVDTFDRRLEHVHRVMNRWPGDNASGF